MHPIMIPCYVFCSNQTSDAPEKGISSLNLESKLPLEALQISSRYKAFNALAFRKIKGRHGRSVMEALMEDIGRLEVCKALQDTNLTYRVESQFLLRACLG